MLKSSTRRFATHPSVKSRFVAPGTFLFCLWLTLGAASAQAEFFYVGAGMDCDSNTIAGGLFLAALNGPGTDTIIIANNQTYTAQKLFISNHSVILQGGFEDCNGTASTERTVISGAGGDNDVVIEYDGTGTASLTQFLTNLEIRGGEQGGVKVQGPNRLLLLNSIITNNMGPGITVDGETAQATIDNDSIVQLNQAAEGAGVHCRLGLVINRGAVSDNQAAGHGGGIYLSACHLVMNGAAGARVERNTAGGNGGGIYSLNALVNLSGISAAPVVVDGNEADGHGGGIYMAVQDLVARNAYITNNTSLGYGGGIYGTLGASIRVDRKDECADTERCSRLSGNVAEGSAGTSGGGAVALTASSEALIYNTFVENNRAGGLDWGGDGSVAHVGNNCTLKIAMSVLARNDGVEALYLDTGAAEVEIYGVTTAEQTVSGETNHWFFSARDSVPVAIKTSIVTDTVRPDTNGNLTVNGLLTTSAQGTLPAVMTNHVVGDPMFTDAAGGDYTPTAASPAVDATTRVSSAFVFDDRDAFWRTRGFVVNDVSTRYDFGALESRGPWVEIFSGGFESGDLTGWSP